MVTAVVQVGPNSHTSALHAKEETLKIDDVRIVREPLVLATQADVEELESRMWVAFPEGYRDYVTRLGDGVLSSFVRIYPPWRIETELAEWRRRINKYWLWDEGRDVLPKERALECVTVGDTINGDEVLFHPMRRNRLFVLPRDSEQVLDAGADLMAAVAWIGHSGELIEPFSEWSFEPFDSRLQADHTEPGPGKVADPEGESLDDLLGIGKRWAARHSVRKSAEHDLKKQVSDLEKQFGKKRSSSFLYEAVVLNGKYADQPGYLAVFRIDDKDQKLEVGTFNWRRNNDSHGSEFTPNQANLARLAKSN